MVHYISTCLDSLGSVVVDEQVFPPRSKLRPLTPILMPDQARPSEASSRVAKGVNVLKSPCRGQRVTYLVSRLPSPVMILGHDPCVATCLSCGTAAVARLMSPSPPRQLSTPNSLKGEAYAFLRNATLPSPMSSVRAPVSSASSTSILSIRRKMCRPLH